MTQNDLEQRWIITHHAPWGPGVVGTLATPDDAESTVSSWQARIPRLRNLHLEPWSEDPSNSEVSAPRRRSRLGPVTLTLQRLPLGTGEIPHRYPVPGLPEQRVIEYYDGPVLVCGRNPDHLAYLAAWIDQHIEEDHEDSEHPHIQDTWRVLLLPEGALETLIQDKFSLDALRVAAHAAYNSYLCKRWTTNKPNALLLELLDDDLAEAQCTWDGDFTTTPSQEPLET